MSELPLAGGSDVALVAAASAAWVGISVAVGVLGTYLPVRLLERDTVLTRIRRIEHRGRIYRRVGVHRWKRRLPEVNGLGPGQRPSKATLGGRAGIPALLRETRRAEYVHVAVAAAGPSFLLWLPRWLGMVMVLAGIAFNAPFVLIQRYNRARLLAVSASRRPDPDRRRPTDRDVEVSCP